MPEARELLASVVRWPLDERVRERVLGETRGNPLALRELPRDGSLAELAGGFGSAAARAAVDASRRASAGRSTLCRRHPAAAAARGRLTGRGPGLVWRAASGSGSPTRGRGPCDRGRADRLRHPGSVPSPVGSHRGIPVGVLRRAAKGTPGAGRGHRPAGPIRTGGPGIALRPRPDPTSPSPRNSRAPRTGRWPAED